MLCGRVNRDGSPFSDEERIVLVGPTISAEESNIVYPFQGHFSTNLTFRFTGEARLSA